MAGMKEEEDREFSNTQHPIYFCSLSLVSATPQTDRDYLRERFYMCACALALLQEDFFIIIIITAVKPSDPQTQTGSKPKLCVFKVVTLRGLEQFLPLVIQFFLPSTILS